MQKAMDVDHSQNRVISSFGMANDSSGRLYHKNPKYSDIRKICCNYPRVMWPKDLQGMANSVDFDQTAVWSGSAQFA